MDWQLTAEDKHPEGFQRLHPRFRPAHSSSKHKRMHLVRGILRDRVLTRVLTFRVTTSQRRFCDFWLNTQMRPERPGTPESRVSC